MTRLNRNNSNKQQVSNAEVGNSLRQEILQLEKRLQEQMSVRCALEKAFGYRASSHDVPADAVIPKPAAELIREISVLEVEVEHLEQYLLSLYRKAFDQQSSYLSPSGKDEGLKSPLLMQRRTCLDFSRSEITSAREFESEPEPQIPPDSKKEVNCESDEKLPGVTMETPVLMRPSGRLYVRATRSHCQ